MTLQTFGVAVLGTGIMGRRMLAALHEHPRFEVRALFDPDREASASAHAAFPSARLASGVEALCAIDEVDLVYVASPPSRHLDGVRAALAAGRACLCEKPLAADLAEAQALRDLVARSGLLFAVNFPFASAAPTRRLVELVRGGELGSIDDASITLRFAHWPRPWQAGASAWLSGAAEGGFTREVLSHFVFLALRLFGDATVDVVRLAREPGRAETSLSARLVHAAATVRIDAAVAGDIADDNRFEIVGTTATATLSQWSRLTYGGHTSDRIDATPATLDRVAAMLEGRTDHGLATADEAAAVVGCIEAMLSA